MNIYKILLILSFQIWTTQTFAQNYKTAAGIRVGTDIGLTLQQYIYRHQTVEAMLTTNVQSKDVRFDVLWEDHYPMLGPRFNAYYGLGLHFARPAEVNTSFVNQRGIVGVLGGELSLGKYVFSADIKPIMNLKVGTSQSVFEFIPGISARYIFVKRESMIERLERKLKNL